MPIVSNHPCFSQPSESSAMIWRYMSLDKFLSLLTTKSLFLSRMDLFDDKFEGASTQANIQLRPELYEGAIPADKLEEISKIYKEFKRWTYAHCWHMSDIESDAMWKYYAFSHGAVAIQSTYQSLIDSVSASEDCYIGMIQYINDDFFIPEDNIIGRFMFKRKSFEYEKEIRLVIQKTPPKASNGIIYIDQDNEPKGINLLVNLDTLIQNIYISPLSGSWVFESVKDLIKKYNLDKKVEYSKLSYEPVY